MRVIRGRVQDVAVDLRKGSPTFGKHESIILSDENKKQLFIPKGFAHGFLPLSEEAIFSYKVDGIYNSDSESGISYNDDSLSINWKPFSVRKIMMDMDNIPFTPPSKKVKSDWLVIGRAVTQGNIKKNIRNLTKELR